MDQRIPKRVVMVKTCKNQGRCATPLFDFQRKDSEEIAKIFKRDARTDEKELETMETEEIARPKEDPVMAIESPWRGKIVVALV
jgi:hypothetical protein